MDVESMNLIMVTSKIFRYKQMYLEKTLKKYGLSSGSSPYLFNLERNEGISQNGLSKELGNDKAMSARTIARLIGLGYVHREQDEKDSRSYKLYLTDKAKKVLPKIHEELQTLMNSITEDVSEAEMLITMQSLRKILVNIRRLKEFED
ncbi:MarR family winged helix-turn-helix transcriptional regulator [Clostridium beijerinckii]|uniref:MarR family winged helix-turn-helix transcriptional regulator n=1 Tax=Clostridium beijerinckii TaxID=1520 RepID=UPI00080A1493|nr:MarR family winged helix-turn-helix transcriptional regulator [Clostridium beijerinckii]OCA96417.1 MarR family transcriptional regulator [Clostridium beijerinckii]